MTEKSDNSFDFTSMMNFWVNSMGQAWGQMVNQTVDQWPGVGEKRKSETSEGNGPPPKGAAAMAAALNNWQAMTKAMTTPESLDSLLKGGGAMPELLLSFAQSSLSSFLELQQKMIERMGRIGDATEAYKFEDIDDNIFRIWTDIYEKELRQFIHIPQLGLMRSYQEKVSAVADNYTVFQSNLSEYLRLLSMPFTRSLQVMQEKLGEMAENGTLPDDTKSYYNLWLKVLEGHFMTLFQTPEYVNTLGRTVTSLAEFSAARDEALEDVLKMFPVARKSDMDDLAREVYELKKRLRKLEKK
jgi:class III poly(R)-hydroxyalkanoic acid synthase PhaE subunit